MNKRSFCLFVLMAHEESDAHISWSTNTAFLAQGNAKSLWDHRALLRSCNRASLASESGKICCLAFHPKLPESTRASCCQPSPNRMTQDELSMVPLGSPRRTPSGSTWTPDSGHLHSAFLLLLLPHISTTWLLACFPGLIWPYCSTETCAKNGVTAAH